jgi:phosphopantetheinyl transferase
MRVDLELVRIPAVPGRLWLASLSPTERRELAQLTHPRRRAEWLAARIALKRLAVTRRLARRQADVEVQKDAQGRPRLRMVRKTAADCSLSHKGGFALAALTTTPGARIGVDIEEVSPRVTGISDRFVQPGDRLAGVGKNVDLRNTLLWCIKEAAVKCGGEGLPELLRGLVCRGTRRGACQVTTLDGRKAARAVYFTIQRGRYVVAVASGKSR